MISLSIIGKSLKLLIRSKGSALVVLLGPLLIVLIIGAGFYDSSENQFNIGVYAPDRGELTERFIGNLDTAENNVIRFEDKEACIDSIKEGLVLTCIVFPQNFVIEDSKTNQVDFYVDESRINLVYRLISSLSLNLDVESAEISEELTAQILQIMARSSLEIDNSLETINDAETLVTTSKINVGDSQSTLSSLDVRDVEVDVSGASGDLEELQEDFSKVNDRAAKTVVKGYALLDKIDYNGTEVYQLIDELDDLNRSLDNTNKSLAKLEELINKIGAVSEGVDTLKKKLDATRDAKLDVLSNFNSLGDDLDALGEDVSSVKSGLESVKKDISSFRIKDAESIVNPISTNIETVTAESGKITYSFPYLLMLIVMFVGIMLSGNLIFMEKDSRAYFRNYTTPIKNYFFLAMTYLTGLLIILVQILVILLIVFLALGVPVFNNFWLVLLTLFLGMSVFIMIGMFLGYLFSTSEGITMSAIAIGSILIFFSNLILPLETLAPAIQAIARFNPYVIASETIRKAMLFDAGMDLLYVDILILLSYSIVIVGVIFLINKKRGSNFGMKQHIGKVEMIPEGKKMIIEEKNLVIKDLPSLINSIRSLTDVEYKEMTKARNIFGDWLEDNLNGKKIADKIKGKPRKQVLDILLKYMNR